MESPLAHMVEIMWLHLYDHNAPRLEEGVYKDLLAKLERYQQPTPKAVVESHVLDALDLAAAQGDGAAARNFAGAYEILHQLG